jgi:hypothetical protein
MTKSVDLQQERIASQIYQVIQNYSNAIVDLLKETNKTRLKGRGTVTNAPLIESSSLRWTLTWKEHKVSYELSILVNIEDDGRKAFVGHMWVHRRASTPIDFEGHTPTTRMRRLTHLNIDEIRDAIELECAE